MASFFLVAPASSQIQPPSADQVTPARFVRADDLVAYVEFDGLDAHAEAWRKTAAYRILNETPTGEMLEELFKQYFTQRPSGTTTAAEKLQLIKHVAKAGFTIGINVSKQNGKNSGAIVLIARGAFSNKEVRPIFARFLQGLPKPGTKPQAVTKSGHKLISGQAERGAFCWWVEETKQEDLIYVTGPPDADEYVLDTLDGKKPSVLEDPLRADLIKPRDGLERTGIAFLNPQPTESPDPRAGMARFFQELGSSRIDLTIGFREEALETVTRLHLDRVAAQPGLLKTLTSILGPGFDKGSLPVMPEGVLGFSALSVDFKSLLVKFPQVRVNLDQLESKAKEKIKIRWQEDLFAHLGEKITVFITPAKSSASLLPNALGLLSKMGGASADSIPKAVILVDVANPTAIGKTLDELMGFVNREIKANYAKLPGPGNESPPPPPSGGRGRGPGGPPTPEFRVMAGETKSYVFTVPPELSSAFPAGLRPTIRVGPKQVAIAGSADLARQALEKKGTFAPPPEIGAAFGRLPSKLNWLLMVDPRDSTPEILASLPGKLQAGINLVATPTAPAAAASGSPASAAGGGLASGSESRSRRGGAGLIRPGGESPGAPAQPAPGPAAAAPVAGAAGPLVLQVDPTKLPTVEDTKKLLFPALYTIDTEGDAVRFTTRDAFPPLPDPSFLGLIVRGVRARANPAAPRDAKDGFSDIPARTPAQAPPAPAGEDRAARQGRQNPGNSPPTAGRVEP